MHLWRAPLLLAALCLAAQATPVVVSGGPDNDYESWLARMPDGRLMVVFDRNPDWVSGNLMVTFSTDDGLTWSAPQPAVADPGDQALPCFVRLPSDTIRLWYSSNESGTYRIESAWSLDGLAWVREGQTKLGWPTGTMHYDPTVVLEPDSSLTMSYRGPSGAYVAHCPRNGTWDTLRTLAGPAGYRPRIMRHPGGTYLLAYHRKSGSGSTNYDVFVRTSTDLRAWSDSVRLTTNLNSHDPFCGLAPDASYLVYYAKYQSPAYNLHRRRSMDGLSWEPEERVTNDAVYNTQPHFFSEAGHIYLVWAHEVEYETDNDVYFERTDYAALAGPRSRALPALPVSPSLARSGASVRLSGLRCGLVELLDASGRKLAPVAVGPGGCVRLPRLAPGVYGLRQNGLRARLLVY